MTASRFALPSLLVAERRARGVLEALLPQAGERMVISAVADDSHAWLLALARLAAVRGVRVETRLSSTGDAPRPTFDLLLNAARSCGVSIAEVLEDAQPSEVDASAWLGRGRWSLETPDRRSWLRRLVDQCRGVQPLTGVEAFDAARGWVVHWPDERGEGMLHRVDAASPVRTCAEARAIDERAIRKFGLPGLCLMEHAGIGATAVAVELLRRRGVRPMPNRPEGDNRNPILVLAGVGNNGGDAMVVARGLHELGYTVVGPAIAGDPDKLAPDARQNADFLAGSNVPAGPLHIQTPEEETELLDVGPPPVLVIDGLLGTGARGEPRGLIRDAIGLINNYAERGIPVLALDVPSGLNGDSGQAAERTVRATATVTFAAVKPGLQRGDGPRFAGECFLADIGVPE